LGGWDGSYIHIFSSGKSSFSDVTPDLFGSLMYMGQSAPEAGLTQDTAMPMAHESKATRLRRLFPG